MFTLTLRLRIQEFGRRYRTFSGLVLEVTISFPLWFVLRWEQAGPLVTKERETDAAAQCHRRRGKTHLPHEL
jgi:hypothetical protein